MMHVTGKGGDSSINTTVNRIAVCHKLCIRLHLDVVDGGWQLEKAWLNLAFFAPANQSPLSCNRQQTGVYMP